ncbi:Holliday junction branch migration protein RuvA [[Clostridium] symbiosum]|uniref:Holliday junction branch migration protein RuvA n=1 Tax=Clostridium symbiosum TaxID=1512 RepID=UPI001D06CED4|nr:Holliday junction branch migration protein RuvA [[Clostridium] symbiosum]MCB6609411.1 Holliday junction branch migration protein RuvA [[Clostridium] symbiosum]MCB6929217.1 Holliday junction branch migration protein RuvA [[Clostridium] symbiosum]
MISYVKGALADKSGDRIVVEAGPVGLGIYVPLSVLEVLPPLGEEVKIYTYLQVREDDLSLYGFLNRQDLEMFKQLIGVNGIGPKGALGILSALRPDDLRLAILTGDAKAISKAPGVGAKTAQRIILDLKDKVSAEEMLVGIAGMEEERTAVPLTKEAGREAVEALVALGYSNLEASKAVKSVQITDDMDAEAVLKASLKFLAFL